MGNFVRHSTENASLDRTIELSTIGRLTPQKNLTLMINFAYRLKLEGINFKLQIVGEGPDRYKLEKKVTDLQLTQEIHFLGKLSEVSQFLTSSDFFIFTSNYEGLGLALLEAMDAGLPIVAPRNSAIPEVLGEDHPGLFVSGDLESLYATFMRFLLDPSLQQQVVDIQASRLKQFDMQSYFWNHHKFYGLS
jgi:glycosyltransferase involved in cell wall biosynthesis